MKTKQKNRPFDFFINSNIIIPVDGKEVTVDLSIFGFYKPAKREGYSIPVPTKFVINRSTAPIAASQDALDKFVKDNPSTIQSLIIREIQDFGAMCLRSESKHGKI